jgi:hypothetical protein
MAKSLLITIAVFLGGIHSALSTHIVGGEFELIHLQEFQYRLNLILYFDEVNGNPGAEDLMVSPYIFRTSDNVFMDSVVLFNSNSTFVPYTQPNCAIGDLITRRILYTTVLELSPTRYDDPEGYYVAWERCCRNNFVSNINYFGQINTVGQTFFLQFPPVVRDGQPFVNSTPSLFPPLRDYACVGNPFYTEFGGTDLDGDSLVYSLVDPLDSSTDQPFPAITTAPYVPIPWVFGIDMQNMVPGAPPLRVNNRGLITVTPDTKGLFVFALKVEEFRDGNKLGEVRRDFQMLVIDGCDFSTPPQVFASKSGSKEVLQVDDTLRFSYEEAKCLNLFVTDEDPNEVITFRAIPVNFTGQLAEVFEFPAGITRDFEDTLKVEVCLPDCPPDESGLMIIDLIAMDDACAVPLIDTTRVIIVIEPPPNSKPEIDPKQVTHVITSESELYELIINGSDLDGDELILDIIPIGFSLEDYGMSFSDLISNPGALSTTFTWDADCRRFDFSERNTFNLLVVVDDEDDCLFSEPDTLELNLVFELPPNNKPQITFENTNQNSIKVDVNSPIDLNILGFDRDNDSIFLDLLEDESSILPSGVSFVPVSGIGNITTNFTWTPNCDDLIANDDGIFNFKFLVGDNNCLSNKADTIELEISVQQGDFNLDNVEPGNVFTPLNGDQYNPVYFVNDLPPGNCQDHFEGVTIYNRWGKLVFEDDQLDFKWDGSDVAPGIYYYLIKYTQSEIKGFVSVLDRNGRPQ